MKTLQRGWIGPDQGPETCEGSSRVARLGWSEPSVKAHDQSGVALLALLGLTQVVEEKDRTIAELAERVAPLEKMVLELAEKTTGQR